MRLLHGAAYWKAVFIFIWVLNGAALIRRWRLSEAQPTLEEIQYKTYGMVNGMVNVMVKRNLWLCNRAGIDAYFCFSVAEEKPHAWIELKSFYN